jgi:CBS domain-containing protein
MGIASGILGFGLGYAAGMKFGDRPIRTMQGTASTARAGAASVSAAADRVRSRMGGVSRRTVDVREVREVMTAAPETVTPETTLRDAATLMERLDIGNVLVVQGEQLLGIVTDRDIALRGVARGLNPATTKVAQVFTSSAVSVSPTASVEEAGRLMREHDVRRLPVVESGRPIGIVSLGDLAASKAGSSVLADISTAPPNN